MGQACPSGSVERIVFRRSSCMHADPISGTVERWTTRMGPAYRTSNRELSSRPLYPAVPASHGAAVTRSAGSAPAELPANWSVRLHGHPRGYRLESCYRAPVLSSGFAIAGPLIGLGRDPCSRNVNPMYRRLRRPQMLSQPARRSARPSLIGPGRPEAMTAVSISSQMPRFRLELQSNTSIVLPTCLGTWDRGLANRRPRIHSGTFALSSAGRDRIGLAWGTVPQAR